MTPKSQLNREDLEALSSRVRALKMSLPEDSVRGLAEEVLKRVAARRDGVVSFAPPRNFQDQVDHLAFALIDDDRDAGLAFVHAIQRAGASVDDVYLVFLAEAARRLGEWWNEDAISLIDVTTGTARIFSILRVLDVAKPRSNIGQERFAVFASTPGEDHTLGVRMAADLFRREGWSIELASGLDHNALVKRIEACAPEIIGLSAGGEASVGSLARLILALRIVLPLSKVLVSGQIVAEAPHRVAEMMPDAVAGTMDQARDEMERLWQEALSPSA